MTGETIMPHVAQAELTLSFSKLIPLDATEGNAEVFGANTVSTISDMISSLQVVVGPDVFIETTGLIETVLGLSAL